MSSRERYQIVYESIGVFRVTGGPAAGTQIRRSFHDMREAIGFQAVRFSQSSCPKGGYGSLFSFPLVKESLSKLYRLSFGARLPIFLLELDLSRIVTVWCAFPERG